MPGQNLGRHGIKYGSRFGPFGKTVIFLICLTVVFQVIKPRAIEITFSEESVPYVNASITVRMVPGESLDETFEFKTDDLGTIRVPNKWKGKPGFYEIRPSSGDTYNLYIDDHMVGQTTLDVVAGYLERTHNYRFLFYQNTQTSKTSTGKAAKEYTKKIRQRWAEEGIDPTQAGDL